MSPQNWPARRRQRAWVIVCAALSLAAVVAGPLVAVLLPVLWLSLLLLWDEL